LGRHPDGIFLFLLFWAQSKHQIAVVACVFPPIIVAIGSGQDTVVFLGVLTASYALFRKQKELPAGLVLGLGLLKFHLFLLWPLALAVQKRWRALAGFSIVARSSPQLAYVSSESTESRTISPFCQTRHSRRRASRRRLELAD